MSRGLLTGSLRLPLVLVLTMCVVSLPVLSGCGGGDQEESATQQKPRALVPGAGPDSAAVDPAAAGAVETSYEAGTLPDAEGVREDPAAADETVPEVEAELKATPVETKAESESPPDRPTTSVSSGDGGYSLQLGSFANLANARKQADRISALGYGAVIEESDLGGQIYHRVMLRGVGDMAEAQRLGEFIHSELGIAYLVRRGK